MLARRAIETIEHLLHLSLSIIYIFWIHNLILSVRVSETIVHLQLEFTSWFRTIAIVMAPIKKLWQWYCQNGPVPEMARSDFWISGSHTVSNETITQARKLASINLSQTPFISQTIKHYSKSRFDLNSSGLLLRFPLLFLAGDNLGA